MTGATARAGSAPLACAVAGEPLGRALEALLGATPEPPGPEVDASDLLGLGAAMADARALALEGVRLAVAAGAQPGAEHDGLRDQLEQRQRRWSTALDRARRVLGERMAAARRLHAGGPSAYR